MISLKNIKKIYGNKENNTIALDGVDLYIEKGEFIAIMGTSGSGKSTLLHILGGMDFITSGEYHFNDENVSNYNLKQIHKFRKKYMSFVFQNFALMNQYTTYENVEMPLIARKVKKRKKLILETLDKLGILDLKDKYPTQLSGGQQQRVAIARAIINEPSIILADEPTGALDTKTASEIMSVFHELNKKGHTIIIVTHDLEVAKQCGRIIEISDGRIVK